MQVRRRTLGGRAMGAASCVVVLCWAAAASALGAENCTSYAAEDAAEGFAGVVLGPLHFGYEHTTLVTMRATELKDAADHHRTPSPLWQCTDRGQNEYGLYAIHNASASSLVLRTGTEENVVALSSPLVDGMWHDVAVLVNGSAVRVRVDGNEVGAFTTVAAVVAGSRSECYLGASSPFTLGFLPAQFRGGLRDFHVSAKALSAQEVRVGGFTSDYSARCSSSGCGGVYTTRAPKRNVGYTHALAAADETYELQGYFTLSAPPAGEEGLVLYGGGTRGCAGTGAVRVYVFTQADGVGAGVGVARVNAPRENAAVPVETPAATRLRLGAAHHVRVVLVLAPFTGGGGGGGTVKIFVDRRLAASETRAWEPPTAGAVTLLSTCHDAVRRPAHAVVQLFQADCAEGFPLQPLSEPATPAPPGEVRPGNRVVRGPLAALWVASETAGGYVSWRDEAGGETGYGGWVATRTPWGAAGNATGLCIVPETQAVVAATGKGLAVSEDGGLTWGSAAFSDVAFDAAAALSGGLLLAVSAATMSVYRSEDLGASWTVHSLPDATVGAAAAARIFAWDNGVAYATSDRAALWVSRDAGVTWTSESEATALLALHEPDTRCLPHVAPGASADDRGAAAVGCGSTLLLRTASAVDALRWRLVPPTHGMAGISGVHRVGPRRDLVVLHANHMTLGREASRVPHVLWTTLVSAAAGRVLNVVPGDDSGDVYFAVAEREILRSVDGGTAWTHVAWHPPDHGVSPTGAAAYAPTCASTHGCSGRGVCYYGLVWDTYPVSCSCTPPYAAPDCARQLRCQELEELLSKDLRCPSNETAVAEESRVVQDACVWRRSEVRPGIVRWRCSPPVSDPQTTRLQ